MHQRITSSSAFKTNSSRIGHAGGRDDINTEWQQSYHLFNPGRETARVTLTFLGFDEEGRQNAEGRHGGLPLQYVVEVAPGAVVRVLSEEIAGLPLEQPFAVRADSSAPICAQMFGRTFTRGVKQTRASYSMMGVPMQLVSDE